MLCCLGLALLPLATRKAGLYSQLAIRFPLKSEGRDRCVQDSYGIQRSLSTNFQGRASSSEDSCGFCLPAVQGDEFSCGLLYGLSPLPFFQSGYDLLGHFLRSLPWIYENIRILNTELFPPEWYRAPFPLGFYQQWLIKQVSEGTFIGHSCPPASFPDHIRGVACVVSEEC